MKKEDLKNRIIAHRGIYNNKDIPENSIGAFKKAISSKIPIELDLQLTKDGQIVVFHDDNLKRLTGIDGKIKNYTYLELRNLKLLGTNYKIPLFSEVVSIVNNKVFLDIEIKHGFNTKKMMNEIFSILDATSQEYVIKSFSPNYLFWIKKHRPEVLYGILSSKYLDHSFLFRLLRFPSTYLIGISFLKPAFVAYDINNLSYYKLKKLRRNGMVIVAWTIKDNNDLEFASQYADSYVCEGIFN